MNRLQREQNNRRPNVVPSFPLIRSLQSSPNGEIGHGKYMKEENANRETTNKENIGIGRIPIERIRIGRIRIRRTYE